MSVVEGGNSIRDRRWRPSDEASRGKEDYELTQPMVHIYAHIRKLTDRSLFFHWGSFLGLPAEVWASDDDENLADRHIPGQESQERSRAYVYDS